MRICVVANPTSIHTKRWLTGLSERGHDLYLIGVSPSLQAAPPGAVPDGVQFFDLTAQYNVRKLRYLIWAIMARRIVNQIHPDLVHAHQAAGCGWVAAATGFHPLLVTAWGSDLLVGPRRSFAQRILAKWVLRKADHLICVSKDLAGAAISLGADLDRLDIVPMGVDTGVYSPVSEQEKSSLKRRLGFESGPLVLAIRGVREIYSPLDIAQAIPLVLERIPSAQFAIRTYSVDPDLLAQFKSILLQANCSQAARYLGELSSEVDIANLYRAADVSISVPSSDGTPVSVLEAMACGTPPILTDLPSLREWVQHEQEALFVPVQDKDSLAAAITRLLTDDALRSTLAANGARLVQRHADRSALAKRGETIYHKLVEQHSG